MRGLLFIDAREHLGCTPRAGGEVTDDDDRLARVGEPVGQKAEQLPDSGRMMTGGR